MSVTSPHGRMAQCACGSVAFEASGAPIISVACYCDDCQEAARQIEALPGAAPVQEADGGTWLLLYRKDRVRITRGAELLLDHKLRDDSPTKRVIANCCNSAMALHFDRGHWYSMYRHRFLSDVPPLQARIQTKFKPGVADAPDNVPSYATYPFSFILRLVSAKIAMLLRR
jgi:hypothetical protein